MTSEPPAKAFISELISSCLSEPSDFVCKMYRTDGITQDSAIEQLFANFYRSEPYEFITFTPHEDQLQRLEQYFSEHKSEFLMHLAEKHAGKFDSPEKAFLEANCEENCIKEILYTFHDCIQEYANTVRLSIMANEDSEIPDKVLSAYNAYTTFVVIMEDKLPSLSEIISKIPSETYPFSLWKYLHQQFVELLLTPLTSQLVEILVNGISQARRDAVDKVIKKGKDKECPLDDFERICQLRSIVSILISGEIDEKSVHFLESTDDFPGGDSYEIIEELIKGQTESMYKEYSTKSLNGVKWKTIICNDMQVLEKTLMPKSMKKMMDHCVEAAKDMWAFDRSQIEHKFAPYHVKDLEVRIYAKRLGVMS